MKYTRYICLTLFAALSAGPVGFAVEGGEGELPAAMISGEAPGFVELGWDDFAPVNCPPETWSERDGMIYCTGRPIGVMRTKKIYKNFELVIQWRHLKPAGNSGLFVWAPPHALEGLPENKLPGYGVEVQMLDHAFKEQYEKNSGRKGDWFSTNGDVFPVGQTKLNPFPPLSPNGARSFPRLNRSKGHGEWNHYYVRGINGEVRLWVNGVEVSGGNGADPNEGHLCLESEGSPIEFKNIRVRELP